jgi:electron transport complex protein RnfG
MKPEYANGLRAGAILLAFALLGTLLLAGTFGWTRPVIRATEEAARAAQLAQVLTPGSYDNDLLHDARPLAPHRLLGTTQPSLAWIARSGGQPVGVVLEAIAPDGYSGEIGLIVGIDAHGVLTGVRVIRHRETPGLGDYIEIAKSPWVSQFAGKSLDNPAPEAWRVKKDGGAFDARAGATVTPRAIVKAVHDALEYFEMQRATLLAPAVGRQSLADTARHDGGEGSPPYTPADVPR